MYIWFGYVPQKTFYHALGQVSVSMNTDLINVKNKSTLNEDKIETKTPKEINSNKTEEWKSTPHNYFENNPWLSIVLLLKELKYKRIILIFQGYFDQVVDDWKCAFDNKLNNDGY